MRGFEGTSTFDAPQDGQEFRRGHVGNGAPADPREDIALEPAQNPIAV